MASELIIHPKSEGVKENCDNLSFTYDLYIDISRSVGGSPSCFITLIGTPFYFGGFPGSSVGKESACSAGDTGSIPGLGRSPGEGLGYPLQYSWVSLVAQQVKNLPAMWEIIFLNIYLFIYLFGYTGLRCGM